MPAFVIFVEGADTEPAKLPVYIVESEEHASLICEGMKESDYQIFDFSFQHCTRSDRGKFAVWATMICDAREGVYGNIVGGIYKMIDGAYSIMSGRRSREKIASGGDTETGNGGSTTAKQDDGTAHVTPVDWTPGKLAIDLKLSADRVNHYGKQAGVETPGRGRREFQYSPESVVQICRTIEGSTAAPETKKAAKALLTRIIGTPKSA